MARSLWKGPFCEVTPSHTHIWSRRSLITPDFVNKTVLIHNGKSFLSLKITQDMIGCKFGEFATTRRKGQHKTKK